MTTLLYIYIHFVNEEFPRYHIYKDRHCARVSQLPNIQDVARHANVSVMTVSRALNNSPLVKESTRQRVLQSMRELNYIPNQLANALYRGESRTFSVIVPDIRNPYFTNVVRGAEDAARSNGYRIILCNTDEDLEKEYDYIEMSYSMRVEGVAIMVSGDESRSNLHRLESFHIPFVLIDRPVRGIRSDIVKGMNEEGANQLVHHLLELGHRRIAIMIGKHSISTWRELQNGYRKAIQGAGLPYSGDLVFHFPSFPHEGALEGVVNSVLHSPGEPTAVIAGSQFEASQVIHILHKKNVRVPEDLSVACFADADPYPYMDNFLTSAELSGHQFGQFAVELLLSRVDGKAQASPARVALPYTIVPRGSTARA